MFSSNVVMKCNDVSLFFLLLCSSATDMEGDDISMNRSSPAISLASRRVMASQVSVPPSGTAPHPSPDSVPEGGAANGNLLRTPVVMNAQPLRCSPPWLRHDMRYPAVMTPPPCAAPSEMITPDVNQTYTHVSVLKKRSVNSLLHLFGVFEKECSYY